MRNILSFLILAAAALTCNDAFATHERAAEITYRFVQGLEYEITIVTYTNSASLATDRPFLDSVHLGDGTTAVFIRTYYNDLPNNIRYNVYKIDNSSYSHIYPAPGAYRIYFIDPSRIDAVENICASINTPICTETWLMAFDPLSYCIDNSPIFNESPLMRCQGGRVYRHNCAASDPDMDSLSYELVPCLGDGGLPIPCYYVPAGCSIDAVTGQIKWMTPDSSAEVDYQLAVRINEWRQGHLIGYVVRDYAFTVFHDVDSVNSFAPLAFPRDTLGHYIVDMNPLDTLQFHADYRYGSVVPGVTCVGEAFSLSGPPATSVTGSGDTMTLSFSWIPDAAKGREEPYLFVIRGDEIYRALDLTVAVYVNGVLTDTCTNFPFPYSINELGEGQSTSILLYPNPTSGNITVQSAESAPIQRLTLYSSDGRIVKAIVNCPLSIVNLNLQGLSAGIYFLDCLTANGSERVKVVKY